MVFHGFNFVGSGFGSGFDDRCVEDSTVDDLLRRTQPAGSIRHTNDAYMGIGGASVCVHIVKHRDTH